jgi:hypothetical protein
VIADGIFGFLVISLHPYNRLTICFLELKFNKSSV